MADPSRDRHGIAGDSKCEGFAPVPHALLDDPLAHMDAEHARHRNLCRSLRKLANEKRIERELARCVVLAMMHDLPLHRRDEDEDLFPLLRKRALPEDNLAPILEQLGEDHAVMAASAKALVEALSTAGDVPEIEIGRRTAILANDFVDHEQRHLAVEAAIVMVIARKRLKRSDLQAMSRSMKFRRGYQT